MQCHGYIGLSNKNEEHWIFLNHRLIYCPFILELIKIAFKERINLSSNQESNVQDLHDKNMFVIFFFILSPREFTFFNEDGERHVMFYNMQKILNNIKNCTFKYLAEETIYAAALSDLRETQPLKQMQLNARDSVFNNKINEYHENVTSLKENKVVAFNLKRKRTTIVTNKRHNKETSNMKIVNFAEEENIVLNSQIDIASTKHTNNLYEGKITKKIYSNVDETSATFTNLTATNNFVESRETRNDYNGNDNDFGNAISLLSEWSDWSYYTNDKECNSAKNVIDKVSKKDINFQRLLNCTDRFNFLPRKLHGLLRHRHVKLTNMKRFDSPSNTISRK